MAHRTFALARAIGIWLALVAVEWIHGVMRRLFLEHFSANQKTNTISTAPGEHTDLPRAKVAELRKLVMARDFWF